MKRLHTWRTYLAWPLILVLFVSTNGLSMHAVYCLCKGELQYTFFQTDADNAACGRTPDSCCRPDDARPLKQHCRVAAATEQLPGSCCAASDSGEHACTTDTIIYTRVAAAFLAPFTGEYTTVPVAPPAPWPFPYSPRITLPVFAASLNSEHPPDTRAQPHIHKPQQARLHCWRC